MKLARSVLQTARFACVACVPLLLTTAICAEDYAPSDEAQCSEFEAGGASLPGDRPPAPESPALAQLRSRAESGDVEAQSRLGLIYRSGEGTSSDDALAFRWFRIAAEAGDPAAQHYLGLFYLSGIGTPVDLEKASFWLRRCAEINAPESLMSLAWFRLDSNHVPRAATHTTALIRNLAENGVVAAQYGLGLLRNSSEDADAQRESLHWLREAAAAGHSDAQFQLGAALLEHDVSDPSASEEAIEWFMKASRQRHARAMRNLGVAHFVGRGVDRDLSRAYGWFWLAAQHGHPIAITDADYVHSLIGEARGIESLKAARLWRDQNPGATPSN